MRPYAVCTTDDSPDAKPLIIDVSPGGNNVKGGANLTAMIAGIFEHISQKMTYGDAQILWVAEQHPEVERIITWNVKDFVSRTHLSVMTPEERIGASQPEA